MRRLRATPGLRPSPAQPLAIPELVETILASIRRDHYLGRIRDYMRDQRALTKSIARYGYECHKRGWEFQSSAVLREIMTILVAIRTGGAEVKYMPRYLEGAIDKHVRCRAEELSAVAKAGRAVPALATRLVREAAGVVAVREKSATETLAEIYLAIPRPGAAKKKRLAAREAREQPMLL